VRLACIRSERAGFTLVEVVLAMGLLVLGMSTILGLLSFGAALSRNAALRSASAAAVEAVVADLEETLFPMQPDGSAGEPQNIEARSVPGHAGLVYDATASPHPDQLGREGGPLEYRVDVEMRWRSAGATRKRVFTTLLLREVPFGERLRLQFIEDRPGPDRPGQEDPSHE